MEACENFEVFRISDLHVFMLTSVFVYERYYVSTVWVCVEIFPGRFTVQSLCAVLDLNVFTNYRPWASEV